MGVVDFDPEKWSRANACEAAADIAKVAKLAEARPHFAKLSQLSQVSQVAPLPVEVRDGVAILRQMKVPRGVRLERWASAVADSLILVEHGWAEKALALGWTLLDLFGAVLARDGDPYADGLAIKLGGRRILAICGAFATVDLGTGGRLYLHRGSNEGARLLWALGRVR